MSIIKRISRTPGFANASVTLFDAVLGGLCMYLAIRWRYSFEKKAIPSNIDENAGFIFMAAVAVVWVATSTHKAIWRYLSLDDIKNLLQGVTLVSIITPVVLFLFFSRAEDFPRSAPLIAGAMFFLALTLSRIIVLFARNGDIRAIFRGQDRSLPDAILIGTDASLHNYLRDMSRKVGGPGFNILGLIDSRSTNRGRSIRGFPILGDFDSIQDIYRKLARQKGEPPTLIATDLTSDRTRSQSLVKVASEIGAPLVRVNQSSSSPLTPFEAADLIGRNVKALDIEPVRRLIAGRRVMITGAGGTIGSEITRQVAGLKPDRMILLDASEFNLYEIDRKLSRDFADGKGNLWFPYLANVCDMDRLRGIFDTEKPDIILHAAALKHVHLGESNPIETLKTNVIGTRNLLTLAHEIGAQSFTLISTDKAVDPTNIMGASKRIAEKLIMSDQTAGSAMSACAVRFGNVLASNGSVVPLFEEQIAHGGPVTVTHKDVKRFFMTTEEAAALVLQAAALNAVQRSDMTSIYVLEMGKPVKIAKLARQLIRLRGHVPDRDIKITYTELRPGEKLNEALTSNRETLESTYVKGVRRISTQLPDPQAIRNNVERLQSAINNQDMDLLKSIFAVLLPRYKLGKYFDVQENTVKSADIIPISEPQKRK